MIRSSSTSTSSGTDQRLVDLDALDLALAVERDLHQAAAGRAGHLDWCRAAPASRPCAPASPAPASSSGRYSSSALVSFVGSSASARRGDARRSALRCRAPPRCARRGRRRAPRAPADAAPPRLRIDCSRASACSRTSARRGSSDDRDHPGLAGPLLEQLLPEPVGEIARRRRVGRNSMRPGSKSTRWTLAKRCARSIASRCCSNSSITSRKLCGCGQCDAASRLGRRRAPSRGAGAAIERAGADAARAAARPARPHRRRLRRVAPSRRAHHLARRAAIRRHRRGAPAPSPPPRAATARSAPRRCP